MTNQPENDNNSPQDMSADEFFATPKEKAVAENNERIQRMSGMVDDLNESLHQAGLNINTQSILVQLVMQYAPISYSRKMYLQNKVRRGERITITDVIFGDLSVGRILRSAFGFIVFIVIFIIASRQ